MSAISYISYFGSDSTGTPGAERITNVPPMFFIQRLIHLTLKCGEVFFAADTFGVSMPDALEYEQLVHPNHRK